MVNWKIEAFSSSLTSVSAAIRLSFSRYTVKHLFSIIVLVAIFFVGCAQRDAAPNKAYLFKSKRQLQLTEREALAGDNAPANRMADYYYFAKNDRADATWWYKLAASRGDPVAKENLKRVLQESQ